MDKPEIPLFPLNTVLFPGGVLPLRIFEPRYLDMVSHCMKNASGFAVVTLIEGKEAGDVAAFYAVGTLARIVDFDRLEDGLLGITCQGEQRLQVNVKGSQADGLLIGEFQEKDSDPPLPLPEKYASLADLLRNILKWEELQSYTRFLVEDWDNAVWVSNRLAELLPMPLSTKQALLELTDPLQRLEIVQTILREQKAS